MCTETTNRYFQVEFDFDSKKRALCHFNGQYFSTNKSCSIVYGLKESTRDCYDTLMSKSEVINFTNLNLAIISLPNVSKNDPTAVYCFIAKATTDLMTVLVAIEGTFSLGK